MDDGPIKPITELLGRFDKDTAIFGIILLLSFGSASVVGSATALLLGGSAVAAYIAFRYALLYARLREQKEMARIENVSAARKSIARHEQDEPPTVDERDV